MPKTVGVLGGMGPKSTIGLMHKIVDRTPAQNDQDHIRMLVDNRPEIPDRTDYLLGKGPSPVGMLQESVQMLEKWGAQIIGIPCNTAHSFIDDIQGVITTPVINMLELLSNQLHQNYPVDSPILLLATTGSLKANLFMRYLEDFRVIIPSENLQENMIMKAIYSIKARGTTELIQQKIVDAIEILSAQQPVCIIAGCTEVGLALQGLTLTTPVLDPLDLLADDIVAKAIE